MLALASLLAVLLQAFVVQPHIHAPSALAEIAATPNGGTDTAIATPVADLHRTIVCVVCQTRAGAGDNLLPAATPVWSDADLTSNSKPRVPPPTTLVHAHPWESRAPPTHL